MRVLALLAAGVIFALVAHPQPAEAQLQRILGGVGRPIADSWKRIVSEPQRFRILPNLVIDPERRSDAITSLSADSAQGLVLAIHADGAAYLWNLERGVRAGGRFGDIVAGVIRGTGRASESVIIHRDGSASALRLDGEHRALGASVQGFDAAVTPVLSGDGRTLAFRTQDGRWHVATIGARPETLFDAAREAQPILSPDGSIVIYRAVRGTLIAGQITGTGVRILGHLEGCGRGVPIYGGGVHTDRHPRHSRR